VVLLNAALADEGIMLASGRWKHAWKTIEAAVNSEGVPVAAHSIRARLQLVVDSYRVDLSTRNLDPAEMSAKQKLLGEYCHKLDDMKNESEGHDNHSLEPTHEKDELEHPESGGANAAELQSIGRSPGSKEPTQGNLAACGQQTITSDIQATQTTQPASTPARILRAPSGLQSRNAIATRTSETARMPPSDSPNQRTSCSQSAVATSAQASTTFPPATSSLSPTDTDPTDITEPVWKRQKLELETILQRFVSEQNERRREQREDERARFSAQQELQKQAIDLQRRALDIHDKAMNMQDRLMALMEKVMDKLN